MNQRYKWIKYGRKYKLQNENRVNTKTGVEMECSDCKGIERLVKAPPGRLNGSLVIEKGCR